MDIPRRRLSFATSSSRSSSWRSWHSHPSSRPSASEPTQARPPAAIAHSKNPRSTPSAERSHRDLRVPLASFAFISLLVLDGRRHQNNPTPQSSAFLPPQIQSPHPSYKNAEPC